MFFFIQSLAIDKITYVERFIASVAQLDRVSASEAECRVFKSPRTHQFSNYFKYWGKCHLLIKPQTFPVVVNIDIHFPVFGISKRSLFCL